MYWLQCGGSKQGGGSDPAAGFASQLQVRHKVLLLLLEDTSNLVHAMSRPARYAVAFLPRPSIGLRCRTRSAPCRVANLAPRPRRYTEEVCFTVEVKNETDALQMNYVASLAHEFAQKRQVDLAPPMAELRSTERELLKLASTIRRRGPLEPFHQTVTNVLDSLQTLEEPAAASASCQNPSHLASIRQVRATIQRSALRLYASHPGGLPYARTLLDQTYRDADARDDVVNVDPDILGTLIRRFRSAETTGFIWRLPTDTDHRAVFHSFLSSILSHLRDLPPDLFTQIMDIHLDSGTPVAVLQPLINKCMRLHAFPGRWTPAAWNVLILAHRRDGNYRGCLDAYRSFRHALTPPCPTPPESAEAWDRYTSSTISWPYEALLAAALESHRLPLTAGQFRAPQDMPYKIWEDLQADGVSVPPRLVAYLLRGARMNGDIRSAHRLWNVFSPDSTDPDKSSTAPAPASSVVKLDIDCYLQYLKLLPLPSAAPRPPLRRIIRHLLEQHITSSQPIPWIRSLWTQVLRTALSPGYQDFPLAIWVLDRFDTNSLPLDADVIDAIASGILRHALAKPRSARYLRSILGEEHAAHLAAQRKRLPRGVQERNMRSRGVTTRDWDFFSRHLASLRSTPGNGQVEMVYLPLGRPLARWTTPKQVATRTTTISHAGADKETDTVDAEALRELARSLRGLLEACITTPQRGVYSFPRDPSVKHLVPLAMQRKAKPDGAALEPDKDSGPAGHLNTGHSPTDVARGERPRGGEEGGDDKKGVAPNEVIQAGERKAREGKAAGNARAGDGKVDGKPVLRRAMQEVYRDLFG
jgi:hypothetical protein